MLEINLLDRVAGAEKVKEDLLIDAVLGEIEVKAMYRRFRTIVPRDIAPGTAGGQDKENPVEHGTMVRARSPDMRFLGREMRLNDCPEIIVDFPECHTFRFLFKTSYNYGMSSMYGQLYSMKDLG